MRQIVFNKLCIVTNETILRFYVQRILKSFILHKDPQSSDNIKHELIFCNQSVFNDFLIFIKFYNNKFVRVNIPKNTIAIAHAENPSISVMNWPVAKIG